MIRGNASEFFTLAARMAAASAASVPAASAVVSTATKAVETGWRANARATSGTHGKHYPNSITSEVQVTGFLVSGEVGPDTSRPQGSMGRGFEFGSRNQPPHLDGAKAVDAAEGAIEAALGNAVGKVLP